MGSDDIFKKAKHRTLVDLRKRPKTVERKLKPRILIVCEGEKTEPQYFEGFRPANIIVRGYGFNTDTLVEKALKVRDNEGPFDQVWCVFDRDDHSPVRFNNAFFIAEKNNIKISYSNEAFELWYCLHFNYLDAAISRQQYSDILSRHLNNKYKKNLPDMYRWLLDKQRDAIRNAELLLAKYPESNPERDKPSTTVHKLVIELNKWNTD